MGLLYLTSLPVFMHKVVIASEYLELQGSHILVMQIQTVFWVVLRPVLIQFMVLNSKDTFNIQ
jgi:hypothetical protein